MVSPEQLPPTGIRVIIVGAGIGGLACAIECHNKGHSVLVLEKFPKLEILGDIISFGPNAGRIMERWGNGTVAERLRPITLNHAGSVWRRFDGVEITRSPTFGLKFGSPVYNGHRGEFHEIFFNFAKEIGVEIQLGQRVEEYWEEEGKAGVVVDGKRLEADLVIGADGVRSKARKLVLGYDDKPHSSGYAVWRTWFTSEELAKDPLTEWITKGDSHTGWFGPDVHFLAASLKKGKDISWVCTHQDDADIEESWSFPGKIEDVLKVVGDWDPVVQTLVKKTPPETLVDWKLVYRDPLPTWVSKGARTCLLGDAAHPFLPTSIQGASQAMEDGVVLAACLHAAGKDRVPLAVRCYERIRYERCRRAQRLGETNRDNWHKADFDNVLEKDKAEGIKLPTPPWLFSHDSETDAYRVFPQVSKDILEGKYGTEEIGYQTGICQKTVTPASIAV
ncbi:FAD/NAD(P)-binding domain-containing protein [Calocera viscosa TUFC12733]|uniref:FAD/NAD(P)-binding domain-containing protein n=1 Tax=Calocera viscosa (strain TUFC12733) TaxID=1330018 RepID=A0A167K938_CALVF|nr:FAD/NAD(P)-binding domain-containing protein [Calocera viscosa TUFC12733]